MPCLVASLKKHFGLRTVKTVLAVLASALLMQYGLHQTPFFACIGAVVAVEKSVSSSLRAALIRNVGTLTGALVGVLIGSFTDSLLLISLGLLPFIWISCAIGKSESIVPGAIVYFAVNYLNTTEQAWAYGVTRFVGTLLGTLIALAINFLIFPPKPAEAPPASPQNHPL